MKVSELIRGLVNVLAEDGDLDVKIGLLNENGDISFDNGLTTFIFPNDVTSGKGYIELTADIEDIKKFKEDIKVLYKPNKYKINVD